MENFTVKCLFVIAFLLFSVLLALLLHSIDLLVLFIVITIVMWVIIVIKEIEKFS